MIRRRYETLKAGSFLNACESEPPNVMYAPQLLDHFQHPRNAGELRGASARVRVQNPACGDLLELAIKLDHGCIEEMRFRAKGCVPVMACASALTELAKGKTVEEAKAIAKDDIVQAVGGVPKASGHAAQLAIDALQQVLNR